MPTPAFTDDAARRSVSVRWARRIVSAALVIGMGAIVLSLMTDVSPNLGPTDPTSGNLEVQEPSRSPLPPTDATTPSPTAAKTKAPPAAAPATTPSPTTASHEETDPPSTSTKRKPGKPTEPPGKPK